MSYKCFDRERMKDFIHRSTVHASITEMVLDKLNKTILRTKLEQCDINRLEYHLTVNDIGEVSNLTIVLPHQPVDVKQNKLLANISFSHSRYGKIKAVKNIRFIHDVSRMKEGV